MQVRAWVFSLGLLATSVLVAGCGGGRSASVPPAQVQTTQRSAVSVLVRVPAATTAASRRAPRYISAASKSIAISVNGAPPVVANLTTGSPGCTTDANGTSCSIAVSAPTGDDTFEETLYDGLSGAGNALSHAKIHWTIAGGQANVVPVTLGGVVASVAIALDASAASAVRGTASTIGVSVAAKDASGAAIIGDPYDTPIALTNSDTSGAATLSTSNVQSPSDSVTLRYTGAKLLNATIGASGFAQGNVTSAVFRPKTASTTAWTTWGGNTQRNGENVDERTISKTNAANLRQLWSFRVSSFTSTQPIVVPNVLVSSIPGDAYVDLVIVGDEHANLYALNADDGSVVWNRQLASQTVDLNACSDSPDGVWGITGTPAVDLARGRLYVVDGSLTIHAIDLANGADSSGWPSGGVRTGENSAIVHAYSAPLFDAARDRIVISTASYCDIGPYYGKVLAFSAANGAPAASPFQVIPTSSGDSGGGVWGMGGAALDPNGGSIYDTTGNGLANDQTPYADSVVHLDESSLNLLGVSPTLPLLPGATDKDFGAGPMIFTPQGCSPLLIAQRKDANLYLYSLPFGNGTNVQWIQTVLAGDPYIGENQATPVFSRATQLLYLTVAGPTPTGATPSLQPGLAAFRVQNCNQLVPAWNTPFGTGDNGGVFSQAVVANGVIYAGDGLSKTIHAFDAASGAELWHASLAGPVFATPTVANGRLFVGDWSHHVTAYAVPGTIGAAVARQAR